MDYKLIYTRSADNDLSKLEKSTRKRIIQKLEYFVSLKDPLEKSKKLKGFKIDTFRFRIGNYRVIFRVDNGKIVILVILRIIHRKSAY